MFDWLRARCPLDDEARAWVDGRWAWLLESYGEETPRRVVAIEPTPEFFPDPWEPTPESARLMFARVQGYMGLADKKLRLAFTREPEDDPSELGIPAEGARSTEGAAGVYHPGRKPTITLSEAGLANPMALVATMAHEMAHAHLRGGKRLSGAPPDEERLTDLLTVFLGLGVFSANAAVVEKTWQDYKSSGWSVGRQGYLRQEEYGWALALFARARGERDPAWASYLCVDVATYLKRSLEVLAREQEQAGG